MRTSASLKYTFWQPLAVLVALTLATQLASVAYFAAQDLPAVLLRSAAALLIVTTPLVALGLWLGMKIGLATPLLSAILSRSPGAWQQLVRDAQPAIGPGLLLGLFLWLLRIAAVDFLPSELPELGHRGAIGGLLVSISAAIGEEIWLRLGVMTVAAWLIVRVAGDSELRPHVAWIAILIAALAFSAIHLPQVAAAGAADAVGIGATMLGNSFVGILCGWMFWRSGLIAATLAHFSVDLVLHVLPALLAFFGGG